MRNDNVALMSQAVGVIVGVVAAIDEAGEPLVAYSGNRSELPVAAKSLVPVNSDSIGREVALLFENGDSARPLIVGLIQNRSLSRVIPSEDRPSKATESPSGLITTVDQCQELIVDGERMELRAKSEISLRCGKSSITMTKAGKIIIRGAYISTRSSGANRIKGGSVQIN